MVLVQLLRGRFVLCSEEVLVSSSQKRATACWIKHGPFRHLMHRTLCEVHLSSSHAVSTSVGMLPEAIARVLKCLLCCVGCWSVGFRNLQMSGAVRITASLLVHLTARKGTHSGRHLTGERTASMDQITVRYVLDRCMLATAIPGHPEARPGWSDILQRANSA